MPNSSIISGIAWSFLEQLGRKGVSLLTTLFLAKLLTPHDFGIIASISLFLALANSLMDSGLKQALIRRVNLSQVDCDSIFYLNLTLGSISYIALFIMSSYIASFYNEPKLEIFIQVSSLSIIINAFQIIPSATLARELNFRAQMYASIPASIISGTLAIILAYNNYGAWALIYQSLASSLLLSIFLVAKVDWRPQFNISIKPIREMWGFGSKLFLAGLSEIAFKNGYTLLIAKLFGIASSGHYYFAEKIKDILLNQLVTSIQSVTYPALAQLQNKPEKLNEMYRTMICSMTFFLFPTMLLTAAFAAPLVNSLFGQKWKLAIPFLQLMCLSSTLFPIHSISLNILKVLGRSDIFLYLEFYRKIVATIVLVISYRYGITGILLGQLSLSVINLIPNCYFASKLISYPLKDLLSDFYPQLLLSLTVSACAYALNCSIEDMDIFKIVAIGPASLLIYILLSSKLNFKAYLISKNLILKRLPR